jgi:hypothetical protein
VRLAIPLVLSGALAAPVAAQTPEQAAAFIGALRDAGCEMSLEAADAAAQARGITLDGLDRIIDLLHVGGLLGVDAEDRVTLLPALCTADPAGDGALFARLDAEIDLETLGAGWGQADPLDLPEIAPDLGARFVAAIRQRGCMVPQDQSSALLAAAGVSEPEARAAFVVLYETGHAVPMGSWNAFRLSEALCAADPAGDAALFAAAAGRLDVPVAPADPDAVLAERFGPEGVRAVLEYLADASDCVLDTSDHAGTVESVVAFMAFNVSGVHNLPAEFSPEAEAELRARVDAMLDDPGPAFAAEPGRLTLIDCTPDG